MKHNVIKSAKGQDQIDKELEDLKFQLSTVKKESDAKKRIINELKIKKRSIKSLFKRNEAL
jgi:hypothetical protein